MGNAAWVWYEYGAAVAGDAAVDDDVPCSGCGRSCSYLRYKNPFPLNSSAASGRRSAITCL